MRYYPIFIDLNGKRAVVVGGGHIAERKVGTLLECGALVTVVSPEITPGLREAVDNGRISWIARTYQAGDLSGAFCTYAATDENAVNTAVFAEASRNSQLCNVVDVPPLCNFIVPSIVDRGDLTIAISSSGNSPALAKRLKSRLGEEYGEEWRALNDLLGRLRPEVKRRYPEEAPRNDLLARLMDAGVLEMLREGRAAEAEELAWQVL
ncbi:MAG TPA: bifunctional precorrin-2 dehydrogenase/sirohydrochlorin ferrochelatase [Armatimonadota bacterium]|jgi:precorrin-2 dehydrogenase/sirohydrochlorin ferrochelatase